ncbi:MAG: RdgB/HAM1 family non-canonical purine NTP pyrophosphatase [Verrucomicrobia bacterium]|nr:RdgB/HAM1 family non-canonical purine NTP pyrophosphatase [Verrucomicrobiota bacterium]
MLEPANPANPYTVLVSTRNAHKLVEIRQILGPSFELLDLSSIPALGEVEETGTTFEENAALKALAASAHFDGWVLADDSGLEVDALSGAPGVRSARFSGEGATDVTNRALLLEKLAGVPSNQRSARFRCVIALARGGEVLAHFSGSVEGAIIGSEKGAGGFGYDPLFMPEGFAETFAELGAETKNRLSHRGRALAGLKSWPGWVR